MLPWSDKGGGNSSSSSSNTLRHDENIANSSQYRPTQSNAESSRFRSQQQQQGQTPLDQGFDTFTSQQREINNPLSFPSMHQQQAPRLTNNLPLQQQPEHHINDGADIQAFLNSSAYSEEVYGDDLVPDSTTYISHRHQMDHQHSVAEQQRLNQWQGLLEAEDIVAYLQEMRYTDDIYGAPPLVEQLIKEAQKEVTQEEDTSTEQKRITAVQRLTMVRDHLMTEARGNVNTAVKQSQQLQQDDWEQIFSSGSVL
ncbi:hypothetical protein INT45_008895 [Circinella minor]|uniref:Uncharacterized protein n=1 Tax=Circinella minor TaxID=1195481 RepID=A0A8H7VDG3_9FUNG|nr:hypothetical protein INT45_008895 [Circinella minor]